MKVMMEMREYSWMRVQEVDLWMRGDKNKNLYKKVGSITLEIQPFLKMYLETSTRELE